MLDDPKIQLQAAILPPIPCTGDSPTWASTSPADFIAHLVRVSVHLDMRAGRTVHIVYEGQWLCRNGNQWRTFTSKDRRLDRAAELILQALEGARCVAKAEIEMDGLPR